MAGGVTAEVPAELTHVLAGLRATAPRVQCLTNTVAQSITANCLHALGVRASMALHPGEVADMSASADAILVNLGTIDAARIAAIDALLRDARCATKPLVLDPVFVQQSRERERVARLLLDGRPILVKGNAAEIAALRPWLEAQTRQTIVTTGAIDRIDSACQPPRQLTGGHPWMAAVTGLGCALGAVLAACLAVEREPMRASVAALTAFAVAGERAALVSRGPGSFAVAFIDELAGLSETSI